ncbi:MAG TPA: glutamyl-tRNA reductase [Candidatus Scybalocola faecipullorum]|nr:glutamyl-tRNA reductase [Candidatus Scybalocola faecipullorum]
MSIQLVSISHKTAPLHIRALFAFDAQTQTALMEKIRSLPLIEECVVIATCNRTEIYTYSSVKDSEREIFEWIRKMLARTVGTAHDISGVLRFYYGPGAEHHLFEVACGLDSMVIGEDQILGQVKNAHQQAMAQHMCGTYLNAFFRYAVTAAKKVKTDTRLSKTPVSTASVCIKAAQDYVGRLEHKKVLLIGATGKIGGIVAKNLMSDYKPQLYVTARGAGKVRQIREDHRGYIYTEIPYERRYDFIGEMDVVISATASPHYTLTREKVSKCITPGKRMAFMDLAVPPDIESNIGELPGVGCFNIDDFAKTARENNEKKLREAGAAKTILETYETEFKKWMLFQQALPDIRRVKESVASDCETKGIDRAVSRLFFKIRENADVDTLERFLKCLERM